ncbi:ferrochelatase [Pleionea sp. CnH1-48]|uniref:ferrochelatase n=1 Tax=Pleionea sp. CnH1-48 TaxID=2954494 RepID=UPI00209729AA|nr:ferrochelatase [Pleionea sp. CnH1-48]MCO7222831.1 ferrochelatase [Pleionea sp. CnH1-48]
MTLRPSVGVLLVNLGTPDAPTPGAIRKYLAEFLHDRRVVDLTRWLWCPILHGVILRIRPAKVAKLYDSIWLPEEGSPLMVVSRQQQQQLALALEKHFGEPVPVALGMTYGNPSIASALSELREKGCDNIVVLPLYPQYSSASTASVFDVIAKALKQQKDIPGLNFIRDYHQHPLYIEALADSVRDYWKSAGLDKVQEEYQSGRRRLMMSFHGIPKRYETEGDPYPEQCRTTAALVAKALDLEDGQWVASFQSRFGREEWVKPYTDQLLEEWPKQDISCVDVICPGFSADCLETLEEIQFQNRELFIESDGKDFHYIPCLNATPAHINMMVDILSKSLSQ